MHQPPQRQTTRANHSNHNGVRCEPLEDRRLCSASLHHIKLPKYVNGGHVYSDGGFKAANWTETPVTTGNGGTSSAVSEKNGGNPGAWQLVIDTVASGASDSAIFGFHGNSGYTIEAGIDNWTMAVKTRKQV
jgi:hypothetical protein